MIPVEWTLDANTYIQHLFNTSKDNIVSLIWSVLSLSLVFSVLYRASNLGR